MKQKQEQSTQNVLSKLPSTIIEDGIRFLEEYGAKEIAAHVRTLEYNINPDDHAVCKNIRYIQAFMIMMSLSETQQFVTDLLMHKSLEGIKAITQLVQLRMNLESILDDALKEATNDK